MKKFQIFNLVSYYERQLSFWMRYTHCAQAAPEPFYDVVDEEHLGVFIASRPTVIFITHQLKQILVAFSARISLASDAS